MFPSGYFPPSYFAPSYFAGTDFIPPAAFPASLESELIAYLNATLPQATWSGALPPNAAKPALILTIVSGDQIFRLDGPAPIGGLETARLQFDAYADSPPAANTALTRLRVALNNLRRRALGRVQVRTCLLLPGGSAYVPTGSGSDAGTHRRTAEYRLTYHLEF